MDIILVSRNKLAIETSFKAGPRATSMRRLEHHFICSVKTTHARAACLLALYMYALYTFLGLIDKKLMVSVAVASVHS